MSSCRASDRSPAFISQFSEKNCLFDFGWCLLLSYTTILGLEFLHWRLAWVISQPLPLTCLLCRPLNGNQTQEPYCAMQQSVHYGNELVTRLLATKSRHSETPQPWMQATVRSQLASWSDLQVATHSLKSLL